MDHTTREEALSILERGFDLALQQAAAQYAVPICWITSDSGQPLILDSGSAFVLDAGEGPFGVTANHVVEGYQKARDSRPDCVCLLGNLRIELNSLLRSRDTAYDLATFDLNESAIQRLREQGKVVLTGSQRSWPPRPPQQDRGVFFVGFPGDGRNMRPYRGGNLVEVDWEGYSALAVATSVSETGITVYLDHDAHCDIGGRRRIPPDWALGGCSGAPLLTLVQEDEILSWRLGGVVYESSASIVKATRADALRSDGTIKPYPDPNAYILRR